LEIDAVARSKAFAVTEEYKLQEDFNQIVLNYPTCWKIRGFDEKVEIHPILVKPSPNYIFWRGQRAGLASCFEYKKRSDLFNHELFSPIVTVLRDTIHQLSP
jgi:hypothetical protein